MDVRRATFWAAIRLAVVFSTIAAVIALGLDAVGGISPTALILAVIVVGFTISWRRTGRIVSQPARLRTQHRVVVVPVRSRLA